MKDRYLVQIKNLEGQVKSKTEKVCRLEEDKLSLMRKNKTHRKILSDCKKLFTDGLSLQTRLEEMVEIEEAVEKESFEESGDGDLNNNVAKKPVVLEDGEIDDVNKSKFLMIFDKGEKKSTPYFGGDGDDEM